MTCVCCAPPTALAPAPVATTFVAACMAAGVPTAGGTPTPLTAEGAVMLRAGAAVVAVAAAADTAAAAAATAA